MIISGFDVGILVSVILKIILPCRFDQNKLERLSPECVIMTSQNFFLVQVSQNHISI